MYILTLFLSFLFSILLLEFTKVKVKDLETTTVYFRYDSRYIIYEDNRLNNCSIIDCVFDKTCMECNISNNTRFRFYTLQRGYVPSVVFYTNKEDTKKLKDTSLPAGYWIAKVDRLRGSGQNYSVYNIFSESNEKVDSFVSIGVILRNDYYFD